MSERPKYELGGRDDPALGQMPFHVRAQVVQAINQQLLTEIVDHVGGEVVLPPGFRERIGEMKRTVETTFLDDGSYQIRARQMPKEVMHMGLGTRWERMEGPRRRDQAPVFYEVVGEDVGGFTEMQKIDEVDGAPLSSPVLKVRTDSLRNRAGGWRPMRVPLELIEGLAGADG